MKIRKTFFFWGGGVRRGRVWGGGQGGCERRIEVFVKFKKKMGEGVVGRFFFFWGGGGQGGCDRRF